MPADEQTGENVPEIKRGRVDSLLLYEITESELDTLETGSPSSVQLNFAIFLLSTAVSFLTTLLSTQITSERLFNVFFIIVVLGFISGAFMLIMWWRAHRSSADVFKRIR